MLYKIIAVKKDIGESPVISWLNSIKADGFIRVRETVELLETYLNSKNDLIKELAARTIIEEVLGEEIEMTTLRLRALEVLKPFVQRNTNSPIYGQMDIHTHTFMSDGYQTPTALILDAYEQGLYTLAITDHDVFTTEEAVIAANILGIRLIQGVEACCQFEGKEVHMLIYADRNKLLHLSEQGRQLLHRLNQIVRGSVKRAREVREKLEEKLGPDFSITDEEFIAASRREPVPMTAFNAVWKKNPDAMRKILPDSTSGKDFFIRYVKAHRPDIYSHVDIRYALTIEEAVLLAHELQGRAILAHPNELDKNDNANAIDIMRRIIQAARVLPYRTHDGSHVFAGVEAYSHKSRQSQITEAIIAAAGEISRMYPDDPIILFAGSDYHGKYSLPDHPLGYTNGYPHDDRDMHVALDGLRLIG